MAENTDVPMMVIDASAMLSFLLPDERHDEMQRIIRRHVEGSMMLIAPPVFPYEVANGLTLSVRRARIDKGTFHSLADQFVNLTVRIVEPSFADACTAAITEGMTVYDASYVVLAREHRAPLLTLDDRLKRLS